MHHLGESNEVQSIRLTLVSKNNLQGQTVHAQRRFHTFGQVAFWTPFRKSDFLSNTWGKDG